VDVAILRPVGGGQVDQEQAGAGVTVDGDGYYTLTVPNGTYKVSAGGNKWANILWPGTSYPIQAGDVVVSNTLPHVTLTDITLYPAGVVRGKVTDAADHPLGFVSVNFYFGFTGIGFCTDQNGLYTTTVPYLDVPFTAVSPSYVKQPGPTPASWLQWPGCYDDPKYVHQFWQNAYAPQDEKTLSVTQVITELDNIDFSLAVDTTPPTVWVWGTNTDGSAYITGTWTNQTVTVHFWCSDDDSRGYFCPAEQIISAEGVTAVVSGTAIDPAGNSATASFGPIQIDRTAPSLTSLDPPSVNAGAQALTLTLTGADFVIGATAHWSGLDLSTTVVSQTALTAVVPAAALSTAGTVTVTVSSPGPDGTTSNPVPLFVTGIPVTVTVQGISSGTNPTVTVGGSGPATPDSLSAVGSGLGTVVISQFSGNPGLTTTFESTGSDTFFDVYIAPDSVFSSLTITTCNLAGGAEIRWDDGSGNWPAVIPQTPDGSRCITLNLSDTSSPTAAQLSGTVFGAFADQTPPTVSASAATADHSGYFTGTWTNQNVTVHFVCSDVGSGVAICPADQTLSAEGVVTVTSEATDMAGNSSPAKFGPIQIDKTPPTLNVVVTPTVSSIVTPTLYLNATATVSAGATDPGGSGVASQQCGALDTTTLGTKTVTCTATDRAGNARQQSITYNVISPTYRIFLPLVRGK
jgi:hypothetical protein